MSAATPEGTQARPSYDQGAVYRRSLLTQAPGGGEGPVFARGPVRRGAVSFGPNRRGAGAGGSGSGVGRIRGLSSPTVNGDEEPDEYVHGSFVVDDDAEISFEAMPSSDDLF